MKTGDLVKYSSKDYQDENMVGLVIETDVNIWDAETVPTGIRVMWSQETTVDSQDELEVFCESR